MFNVNTAGWPAWSWHHFCTVSDAATTSTPYVDGQVQYSGVPMSSSSKVTILGWYGLNAYYDLDAAISEVAWTHQAALSAEEIANVYNRGAA